MKCFAQIAKRLSVGFVKIADAVVRLPPEILGVQSVVSIEFCQIGGQLVRCVIQSVNVGMRRGDCGVVGSTQHDRHDVSLHHFEKFLRDVISADRVLKRQVEFVHFLDVVVTNVLVLLSGTHVFAAAFSAFTEDVLLNIFSQHFDVILSVALGLAVGNQPNGQLCLSRGWIHIRIAINKS